MVDLSRTGVYAKAMPALVISGDLISSRAYGADKAARTLAAVVAEINASFANELLVPLDVMQGDAFQGVADNGPAATTIIFHLQGRLISSTDGRLMSRFGLGLGAIDQKLGNVHDPSLLTGPAFVAANEALERARKKKRQIILKSNRNYLDSAANGAFGLAEHVWSRWKSEVWRRALRYSELNNMKKLANELNISYQAVYKQLHSRGVLAVLEALEGIGGILQEVGG